MLPETGRISATVIIASRHLPRCKTHLLVGFHHTMMRNSLRITSERQCEMLEESVCLRDSFPDFHFLGASSKRMPGGAGKAAPPPTVSPSPSGPVLVGRSVPVYVEVNLL